MTISSVRPLYVGNALQVSYVPPASAKLIRLLRKDADNFTGQADANAVIAYEGTERSITDAFALLNEVPVFYKAYYFDGAVWTASATATGTPLATYADASTDALSLVRDRLERGLQVEVARGTLTPNGRTYIQVLTAPPLADGGVELPVVTVHLESEKPGIRGLGEMIAGDELGALDGKWVEHEGWMADVQIEISGWSLNPDERIELRKALRRILVANLPVFDAAGMTEIDFTQRDQDAVSGEFAAPVYMSVCSFTCQAPIIVTNKVNPITDIVVTASGEYPPVTA